MRSFMKFMLVMCRTSIMYMVALAQIVTSGLYAYFISGLQKPGGLKEAVNFFFSQPDKYTLSFIFGIVAIIINIFLIISIITEIPVVNDIILEDNYYFNRNYPTNKNQLIAKVIIVIVLSILNWFMLKFIFSIILAFALLVVILWAILS